ncbi:pH regulation protein F [Halomonas campisalis]|uniref:PH regulation protein F n=1 Tax=Billgrantia campisalis TaxID=74661 RepID=A0ABS9P7B9_9GAMM|nr:monovalent cation/H+ antiporter complex subunit F [Halomonas campisalis]MCG6657677.1 pH regulation protein F [Halomonas campisalis]MDR5862551.1 monovalent cation/H+ antiporter complex subunit F [Halomonas campisalis]
MLVVIALAVLVSIGCALTRAYLGPTLFDRLLAVNAVGSLTVLLIALLGFIVGRPEFIDIAIVYSLLNYIGVVAVLQFFESGRFGASRRGSEEEKP